MIRIRGATPFYFLSFSRVIVIDQKYQCQIVNLPESEIEIMCLLFTHKGKWMSEVCWLL